MRARGAGSLGIVDKAAVLDGLMPLVKSFDGADAALAVGYLAWADDPVRARDAIGAAVESFPWLDRWLLFSEGDEARLRAAGCVFSRTVAALRRGSDVDEAAALFSSEVGPKPGGAGALIGQLLLPLAGKTRDLAQLLERSLVPADRVMALHLRRDVLGGAPPRREEVARLDGLYGLVAAEVSLDSRLPKELASEGIGALRAYLDKITRVAPASVERVVCERVLQLLAPKGVVNAEPLLGAAQSERAWRIFAGWTARRAAGSRRDELFAQMALSRSSTSLQSVHQLRAALLALACGEPHRCLELASARDLDYRGLEGLVARTRIAGCLAIGRRAEALRHALDAARYLPAAERDSALLTIVCIARPSERAALGEPLAAELLARSNEEADLPAALLLWGVPRERRKTFEHLTALRPEQGPAFDAASAFSADGPSTPSDLSTLAWWARAVRGGSSRLLDDEQLSVLAEGLDTATLERVLCPALVESALSVDLQDAAAAWARELGQPQPGSAAERAVTALEVQQHGAEVLERLMAQDAPAPLLLCSARVAGEGMDEIKQRAYRRVLERDPLAIEALSLLVDLLPTRSPEWMELMRRLVARPDVRQNHLLALAQALSAPSPSDGASALTEALPVWSQALACDPSDEDIAAQFVDAVSSVETAELKAYVTDLRQSATGCAALAHLSERNEQWTEAMDWWCRCALLEKSDDERAVALRRAAELGSACGAPAGQLQQWLEYAIFLAADERSVELLKEITLEDGSVQDFAATLRRSMPADQKKAGLLHQLLARELRSFPGGEQFARQELRLAVSLDDTNIQTLRALELMLRGADDTGERATILARLVELEQNWSEKREVMVWLAELYLSQGDQAAAIGMAERLMASDNPLGSDGFQLCERVLADQGVPRMLALYAQRIDEIGPETTGAATLLHERAELEMQVGQDEEAEKTLVRLLALEPGNARVLALLSDLWRRSGRNDKIAVLYEDQVEKIQRVEDKVALLLDAARASRDDGYVAAANRLFEKVHQLDPSNREAFVAIGRKLSREQSYQELGELLRARASHVGDPAERVRTLKRAARLAEQLGDVEQATEIYREALTIIPDDPDVLGSAARIYEATERWPDFLEVVDKQIGVAKSAGDEAKLHFKYGSVLESEFKDLAGARARYERAVRVSADCLPALHGLQDLAGRQGDWRRVIEVLLVEEGVWKTAEGKASIFARVGDIYAKQLADRRQALSYYKKAISIDRKCAPAAYALFELHADGGHVEQAAAWGSVCVKRVNLRRAGADEPSFYARWAQLLMQNGEPERALEAIELAVTARAVAPGLLWVLLDLCERGVAPDELATLVVQLVEHAPRDEKSQAVLATCRGIVAQSNGDLDQALTLFREGHARLPEKMSICRPLADLLTVLAQEEEAAALVTRCAQLAEDSQSRQDAEMWLARHQLLRLSKPVEAVKVLKGLADRGNHEVTLLLARVLSLLGDHQSAYSYAVAARVQKEEDRVTGTELAESLHWLGLTSWRSGREDEAVQSWGRCDEVAPSFIEAHLGLSRMLYEQGDVAGASRELRLAEQATSDRQGEVLHWRAELYRSMGRANRAEVLYRKAARHPAGASSLVQLARQVARAGDPSQAIGLLLDAMQAEVPPLAFFEALHEIAGVAGDDDRARRAGQVLAAGIDMELEGVARPGTKVHLKRASWEELTQSVTNSPYTRLLAILGELLSSANIGTTTPVERELQQFVSLMGPPFGVQLSAWWGGTRGRMLRMQNKMLFLHPMLAEVDGGALRSLVGAAVVSQKLGLELIFGESPAGLRQLASALRETWNPSAEQLAALSRQARKELATLHKQFGDQGLPPFDSWVREATAMRDRLVLQIMGDFSACSRFLAFTQGFGISALTEGSAYSLLPEIVNLARYYVSDSFRAEQLMLTGAAG